MNNVALAGQVETGIQPNETVTKRNPVKNDPLKQAYADLEKRVFYALQTYSNVHRGSGHFSAATTALFENARAVILESLHLPKKDYQVIFCSVYFAEILKTQINHDDFQIISSGELGLPLGLSVMVIKKRSLPKGIPLQTGGSTARMVSANRVIWADAPSRHEAGTPSVMNAITFAIAFLLRRKYMISNFAATEASASVQDILYHDEFSEDSGLKLIAELQKSMPGKNLEVPTKEGNVNYINFDNAASTPAFLPVWHTVKTVWRLPLSVRKEIPDEVRKIVAGFLGCPRESHEIIFTANTTEAINIASKLVQTTFKHESRPVILNTLLEHNSNELPWRHLKGFSQIRMPVDREGFINTAELENILKKYNVDKAYGSQKICLVAVSGASNVLGTYNYLQEISRIVHCYGAQLMVDGAQLVAHREVSMEKTGIDYFAFSGHKAYAPFGSGALIVRKGIVQTDAGELEKTLKAGDENTTGIAAIGKAFVLLQRVGMQVVEENENILVSRLLKGLQSVKGVRAYGVLNPDARYRGGIVSFESQTLLHNKLAKELAEKGGIGVRFGCFCTHMLVKHVVRLPRFFIGIQNFVFTVAPKLSSSIPGLMRVSVGIENEAIEVDRFIDLLNRILDGKRNSVNGEKRTAAKNIAETEKFSKQRIEQVFGFETR
jgi:selenocysteine lyase/cysteine desulfurase